MTKKGRNTNCPKQVIVGGTLVLFATVLFSLCLFIGPVRIPYNEIINILMGETSDRPSWQFIILDTRLPQALTSILCGASLATSGLVLQTTFHNPLAGPDVLGVSSGASLGVALVMLLWGGSVTTALFTWTGFMAVIGSAFAGAMAITALIFLFSTLMRNSLMLLIAGLMVGYVASSVVSLLNYFATEEGIRSFMVWGMGNFGGVSLQFVPAFALINLSAMALCLLLIKPLNIIQLGSQYADSMGIATHRVRNGLLILVGLLTATTTAFCGPIAFIGLAVPHIARLLLGNDDQRMLMPCTMLCGSVVALLCNLLCSLPSDGGIIPINAVTPLIGAPVVIYIIMRKRC